jgi:hypothetical protein
MHSTQPRSPTNLSSYLSFAAAGPNGLKITRFTDGQDTQAQPPGAAASDFRLWAVLSAISWSGTTVAEDHPA